MMRSVALRDCERLLFNQRPSTAGHYFGFTVRFRADIEATRSEPPQFQGHTPVCSAISSASQLYAPGALPLPGPFELRCQAAPSAILDWSYLTRTET